MRKSQTNATNATMPPLRQANLGDIQLHTVEKSQTNATSVTMHPPRKVCDFASSSADFLRDRLKTHSREKSNKYP